MFLEPQYQWQQAFLPKQVGVDYRPTGAKKQGYKQREKKGKMKDNKRTNIEKEERQLKTETNKKVKKNK
jgi:hypothetical protein